MASLISNLADLLGISPKPPKTKTQTVSRTTTFNPTAQGGVLSVPAYQEHLTDLFSTRTSSDSRTLLVDMFKQDPDVAAAVSGYLTLADTTMLAYVVDPTSGAIDPAATQTLESLIYALTEPWDYTQGFQLKPDQATLAEEMRYMTLLRGGVANELVFDKNLTPSALANVDLATIQWTEKQSGIYKPFQLDSTTGNQINLDIPSFFVSFHRRDPTKIYQYSDFVAAINTIASRQLVINELYSIMKQTGYSRIAVEVVEEVVLKNAPASVKTDPAKLRDYMNNRLQLIGGQLASLSNGQPFIHWDSAKPSILNENNPSAALDIRPVIEVLNAQNQAALKTMPTILGRGTSTQTAAAEVRYAAMSADELNKPVSTNLRRVFQFALNVQGVAGIVKCSFLPAELRPHDELEPHRVMKASRLRQDLSDGLITDEEYHMWMYHRLPPATAPQLSGTKFMGEPGATANEAQVDASSVSPNSDPLGRSIAAPGAKSAKSNQTKGATGKRVVAGLDAVELAAELLARQHERNNA